MSAFEDVMNRLTDMDAAWKPFLYLRPAKDQPIDNALLVKMSIHFGPMFGVIAALVPLALRHQLPSLPSLAFYLLASTLMFFVVYKFTFAYFWNLRARRLQAQR